MFEAIMATSATLAQAMPRTFYVAASGNDAWTGTRPRPNHARTDGPFATLDRARDAIRKGRASGGLPTGGVTVDVEAGTWRMERSFALTVEDSGTAQSPITYRAKTGADVRIDRGGRIAKWEQGR